MSTAAVEPSVRHADASEPAAPAAHAPRTRLLLHGAILPTLLRLASPNVLVVLAQTATGLVAMVGTGIGAGHYDRALRVAFIGGAVAFAVTESIGVAAAL
jgi:Na+-driven multidrug efflux pump